MTTHEIDDLGFPPLEGRYQHQPLQPQSVYDLGPSIPVQLPSMFLDSDLLMLDTQTIDQIFATPLTDEQMISEPPYHTSQAPTSQAPTIDPKATDRRHPAQALQPLRTDDLLPGYQNGQFDSVSDQFVGDSYAAEHSYPSQAQEQTSSTPRLKNRKLLQEQQMPGIYQENCSSPNAAGGALESPSRSGGQRTPRRNQQSRHNTLSRISETGAIKKIEKPEPIVLPPQATQALMTTKGLQKFAHIEDANELHPRIRTRILFEPEKVYAKLDSRPAAWNNFSYNEYGELKAGQTFTVEEVYTYLYHHPLHTLSNGQFNPKKGGLKLWIQRNPADSKSRYGESCSSRCRFKDCIAENHLIGQGQVRVCFDELSCRGQNLDPFFNAGYVHLWCLERFMDFPKICQTLQVKVENRILVHEPNVKNRMMLRSAQEIREAERFIRKCDQGKVPDSYPHFPNT